MLKKSGIDGIYIIHAKTGYELHENRIKLLFKENSLDYEFVTDGDPSLFTKELLSKYFTDEMLSRWSDGIISCTLNHINAYERIVKNKNRYAIIFENDPFFLGDFSQNIKEIIAEIKDLEKGFIISIENTTLRFPSFWAVKKGKHLFRAKTGRCAGAYIIDLECAKRILSYVQTNKCSTVIDWWHNTLITNHIFKMYWAHPPLVEQGSHNGQLNSTISTKPNSLRRRLRWLAQKAYKSSFKRLFNDKYIYS
jgi:glycosyl transferase, family 25